MPPDGRESCRLQQSESSLLKIFVRYADGGNAHADKHPPPRLIPDGSPRTKIFLSVYRWCERRELVQMDEWKKLRRITRGGRDRNRPFRRCSRIASKPPAMLRSTIPTAILEPRLLPGGCNAGSRKRAFQRRWNDINPRRKSNLTITEGQSHEYLFRFVSSTSREYHPRESTTTAGQLANSRSARSNKSRPN